MRTIIKVVAVGLTLSIMAPPVVAQEFVWAKRMGGTSLDFGSSVAIDGAGNVYTTGSFKGTADFDPDPAVTFPLTSAGSLRGVWGGVKRVKLFHIHSPLRKFVSSLVP